MIRVVFDTNVIISALNFPGSNPDKTVRLALVGTVKNIICPAILLETKEVLTKKFRWNNDKTQSALNWVQLFSKTIYPKKTLEIASHSADNRFLECALAGRANIIITGDNHLLSLKKFRKIIILTPKEFLEILEDF